MMKHFFLFLVAMNQLCFFALGESELKVKELNETEKCAVLFYERGMEAKKQGSSVLSLMGTSIQESLEDALKSDEFTALRSSYLALEKNLLETGFKRKTSLGKLKLEAYSPEVHDKDTYGFSYEVEYGRSCANVPSCVEEIMTLKISGWVDIIRSERKIRRITPQSVTVNHALIIEQGGSGSVGGRK